MSNLDPFELPHERAERERPDPCPDLFVDHGYCEHVNLVMPRFYVGDMRYRYQEWHEEDLRALGITHVVDCRTEEERSIDPRPEPKWCHIFLAPTPDDTRRKRTRYFERIARWAGEVDEEGATFFFHCQAGINRGPSALYAVLRLRDSRSSARSVLSSIRTARPIAAVSYWRDAEDAVLEIQERGKEHSDA